MPSSPRHENFADRVYQQVRSELFEFRLLPGDRFSEAEVAQRTGVSRTPVRQALYQLQREGFLDVNFRNGWEVRALDFSEIDALYELRILLEQAAIKRLQKLSAEALDAALTPLEKRWLVPVKKRSKNNDEVSVWDEDFHCGLVRAGNNSEFARVHLEVTERIRIVRRLDFTEPARIVATYDEHSSILQALRLRRFRDAMDQLERHIEVSRTKASQITLSRLQNVRKSLDAPKVAKGR